MIGKVENVADRLMAELLRATADTLAARRRVAAPAVAAVVAAVVASHGGLKPRFQMDAKLRGVLGARRAHLATVQRGWGMRPDNRLSV